MIVLDLCQLHYQVFLIAYLKLTEECKACMNEENIKSRCDFIGLINNNLCCKYKECEKIWLKPLSSSLANSLSGINKKECKACMERKNIKSECEFIGLKNNKLSYKCKECEINGLNQ